MNPYVRRIQPYLGSTILEIAAGGGQVAVELCELVKPQRYVAVEVQNRLLPRIRANPPKMLRYVLTDAYDKRYHPKGKAGPTLPGGQYAFIHGKSWLTHVVPQEFAKYVPLFVERLLPGGFLALTLFVDDARHGKVVRNCLYVYYGVNYLEAISRKLVLVKIDRGGWTPTHPAPHDIAIWRRK